MRIAGYGYPTGFFIRREIENRTVYTENEKYGWRFFPRQVARRPLECVLPKQKPENVFRIFVLGGSAAMGDPDPSYSFGRILELLLDSNYPHREFQVINAAMTGINSHVAHQISKDCDDFKPDLFVVYMGNNEVVGPFGTGTVFSKFSKSLALIRFRIWLESTGIGQLLSRLKEKLGKEESALKAWGGMTMFLDHKLRADDPRLGVAREQYRENLQDICNVAAEAGAKTILCTVAVNLESCAPFASKFDPNLSDLRRGKWRGFYEAGIERERSGDFGGALEKYRLAEEIDATYADLLFRIGNCLEALDRSEEALEYYQKACDWDALRFRADSSLNHIIHEITKEEKENDIYLVDFSKTLNKNGGALSTGDNLFYDHVHLNFHGNYLLAKMVFEKVHQAITSGDGSKSPLTESECRRRLAFTRCDQYRIEKLMLQRMSRPPFTAQLDHEEKMSSLVKRLAELEKHTRGPGMDEAVSTYQDAITQHPEDWQIRENFAALLQHTEKAKLEAEQWQKVINLTPHRWERYAKLGQAYARAGDFEKAVRACRKVLDLDPGNAMAHNGLGMAYASRGDKDKAVFHYEKALKVRPGYTDVHHNLGVLFAEQGRYNEAEKHFHELVRLTPGDAEAFYNLALIALDSKKEEKSLQLFKQALERDPGHAFAHYHMAAILAQSNRVKEGIVHYNKALQLRPDWPDPANQLAWLYATHPDERFRNGREAVKLAERACRVTEFKEALYVDTLAAAYAEAGDFEKAIEAAENGLELAESAGRETFARDVRQRIELYNKGRCFRESLAPLP